MDLDTFTGLKVGTAVEVNGLFVPANSLSAHLRRYCEPALFHTEGMDLFHLSKSGSLARVKANGRYFALATRHQVVGREYDYSQFVMVGEDNRTLFSAQAAVFPEGNSELVYDFDILRFEFTALVEDGRLPSSVWYDLTPELDRTRLPHPKLVCCIGYPGFRNWIRFDEGEYPRAPNAVWGREAPPGFSGRLSFKPTPPIKFEPDGMSGSPVFGLQIDQGKAAVYFAGILTHATQHLFNFISMTRISSMFS